MSYVSNTSEFTFVQMQVLAKARSDPGIHIILTNPYVSQEVSSGGEVTVCRLPRGIENGTIQTHVLRVPDLKYLAKYRFRKDDGLYGDNTGDYMEHYWQTGEIRFYQRKGTNLKQKTLECGSSNMKAPMVRQMDVKDNGAIMVSCNGGTTADADLPNFCREFVLQRIDQKFDSMMVMEIHVSYKSDRNKVFNTVLYTFIAVSDADQENCIL
ncbi:uncharacterized protein LOC135388583 [Ornithodoros turicata]|uniref:uncharacterized protein LOC135388583 n=1 Tax=Ornithodoros turicata TaxID=34597 RepID=UPI00313965F3